MNDPLTHTASLPPKTRLQVADEFGFSYDTLRRRLRQHNIRVPRGRLLSPRDQVRIYESIYWPSCVKKSDYRHLLEG